MNYRRNNRRVFPVLVIAVLLLLGLTQSTSAIIKDMQLNGGGTVTKY